MVKVTGPAREVLVRYERCLGCRSCELACAVAHSGSGSLFAALWEEKPPRKRVFVEQAGRARVTLSCRHCQEAWCIDACISGAMHRTPEGVVTNTGTDQGCVGCWMCVMACPYGVIRADYTEGVAVKCDRACLDEKEIPACVRACPTKALVYMTVEEFERARRHQVLDRLLPVAGG